MTGLELKAIRKNLGLSQEALASLVGARDNSAVSRWEAGKRPIPRSVEIILDGAGKKGKN